MISEKIGHKLDAPLALIIRNSFFSSVSPTALTLAGLGLNLIAAGFILYGYWKVAAIMILAAGFCDMLDGAAARIFNKATPFGGFIDSVVDRYSDMILVIAFIIYYAMHNEVGMVCLCAVASVGFVLIPYTRARAERFISSCNIGIMERAERILLISAGCLINCMTFVFWILAFLTHMTVLQRIVYTWKESQNKIT